jgi:UDP-glucose 4-epimerase
MNNRKKISLVTGGAGFIGSELVRQLLKNGNYVIAYDNFAVGKKSNLPQSEFLEIIEGDLRDGKKIRETFKKKRPQNVFHLAALHFIPYCISHPQETIQVNVEGTLNVLEACKSSDVESLVYASSAAVYPIKDTPHSENDKPGPIEIYGATKLFGEELIKIFNKETRVKCAIARLFNGYGRRETNPHVIPDILDQLPNGNKITLGNVEPKRDFIHTSDISSALRSISDNNGYSFEVFNVGTGTGRSVKKIVEIIAKILNRPLKIEISDIRRRKIERLHLVSDISKIQNMIGWSPKVSIIDGFKDMLESAGLYSH